MIREKLETLSDELLIEYAATLGVVAPPGLERRFLVEAIVEFVEDDLGERDEPAISSESMESRRLSFPFIGLLTTQDDIVPIEDHYNETRIVLMLRDPYWAYTYWEIKETERKSLSIDPSFDELVIRVVETADEESSKTDFFDISISLDDTHWYINLPNQNRRCYIELICRTHDSEKILARSEIVRTPGTINSLPEKEGIGTNASILELSGLSGLIDAGLVSRSVALSRAR